MKKFHVVYKIEDPDGNYYIGKHSTDDLEDGYIGSGSWSKYLSENNIQITKIYLAFYDSCEDAYNAEILFLGNSWKDDPKCKNKIPGGKISQFEQFNYSRYCLVKYGVDHHMKSEEFKSNFKFPFEDEKVQEKVDKTIKCKYGGRGSGSKIIKQKIEQTNLERYGELHTLKCDNVKSARENAIQEKYGTDNPWKNREKFEEVLFEKYGWKNPMGCPEIRAKHRQSMQSKDWTERNKKTKAKCLEKYGISNPVNLPEIREKHKRNCPFGCKDNHNFDVGNFSNHMKKIHNWTKEQIQRYKDEN